MLFHNTKVKLANSGYNGSKNLSIDKIRNNEKILDYLFRRTNSRFIQNSTLFVHSRLTFLTNLFDEPVPKYQDWDWLINAQNKLDVQFKMVDDVLVEYRINQ